MRLVQVETFYPSYLRQFYNAHKSLRRASFGDHVSALVRDGFSAIHTIAPYLEPLGYDSHFIIGNCGPAQRAWMRENGYPIPDPAREAHDIVRRQIDNLRPDILYLTDPVTYDSRFVRALKHRPELVIGWQAARIPSGTDWSEFDVILSGLSGVRRAALSLGARAAEHFMPGLPEWIAQACLDVPEQHDVVFAGSYTRQQHPQRNALLKVIAEASERFGFDCAFHLGGDIDDAPEAIRRVLRPQVFGLAMNRVLKSGRIVFDSRGVIDMPAEGGQTVDMAGLESANMRIFETTGVGSFLLTGHYENLSRHFTVGEEIETFTSEGELIEKIRYYLAHPDRRREIAARGQARCLHDHSMTQRVQQFDGIVRTHLRSRSAVTVPAASLASTGEMHLCTTFGAAGAARGLTMLDSVRGSGGRMHVLCLDRAAERIVRNRLPTASVVTREDLETWAPELRTLRSGGASGAAAVEALTACLLAFVLARFSQASAVGYASPEIFFFGTVDEAITAASGPVTAYAPLGKDGLPAWAVWRNNEAALEHLAAWRRVACDVSGSSDATTEVWSAQRVQFLPPAFGRWWRSAEGSGIPDESSGDRPVFADFRAVRLERPGHWTLPTDPPIPDAAVEKFARPYAATVEAIHAALSAFYSIASSPLAEEAEETDVPARVSLTFAHPGSGYTIIDRDAAVALAQDDGWAYADVAQAQDVAYTALLRDMFAGSPRIDLAVAAAAVEAAELACPSVLEVGCGSGYYSQVFRHFLRGQVSYAGLDRSAGMIALARASHPQVPFTVGDATGMPFEDDSFEIVFNGASLMHTMDYEAAVAESRRVARDYCIFHTVPVLARRPTTYLRKTGYGRPMTEVALNEGELRMLFARHGLLVRRVWRSIGYDLGSILGEPTVTKTFLCEKVPHIDPGRPLLLNIGCGEHYHNDWVNLDFTGHSYSVLVHDVAYGLPFPDACFDGVYHSHVLEHLPRDDAPAFLRECYRVLKPGGTLRVVVPDLETIARTYVRLLSAAANGDARAADEYEWIAVELLDQMVRHQTGGVMRRMLSRRSSLPESFVIERVGENALLSTAAVDDAGPWWAPGYRPGRHLAAHDVGCFRLAGEVHQWMYDRYSLAKLLDGAGFENIRVREASSSGLEAFARYGLDVGCDGRPRKPDSLFMEGVKGI